MNFDEYVDAVQRPVANEATESSNIDGLIWEDGIGTLPGTDFKFRMVNGEIEMIEQFNFSNETEEEAGLQTNGVPEDLQVNHEEEENVSNQDEKNGDVNKEDCEEKMEIEEDENPLEDSKKQNEGSISTASIATCLICGVRGKASTFCGKFCSRVCVGRNAARHKKMRSDANRNSQSTERQNSEDRNMVITDKNNLKMKIRLSSSPDDVPSSQSSKRRISQNASLMDETPKRRKFVWSQYLESEKAKAAPVAVFKNVLNRPPFPSTTNPFKCGMALEGVDPIHQSLICCLSVAEVRGHRIRLHFEGFNELYDFWTVADSPRLFSCGFSKRSGRKVTVPRGYTDDSFSWTNHMKKYKLYAAPKEIFDKNESEADDNLFEIGNKLEAVDKQNPDLTCVATVTDKVADIILVHFDGWAHDFDYWCCTMSNYIHAVGWCQANGKLLSPPEGYPDITNFTWEKYLDETSAIAADEKAFKNTSIHGFEDGMRLEAVDGRNPVLVRVATVAEVDNFRIKVHFDGWSKKYDLWMDIDSEDLHPVGWCAQTRHSLQPPVLADELTVQPGQGGCPILGCKGIGHVKGAKYSGHYSEFGCPYSPQNMHRDSVPDRLIPSKGSGRHSTQHSSAQISSKYPDGKRKQNNAVSDDVNDPDFHMEKEARQGKRRHLRHSISATGSRRRRSSTLPHSIDKDNKMVVSSNNINDLVDHNGDSYYSSKQHSVFVSALSSYPSYDVPLCWEQQLQLIPNMKLTSPEEVANWSSDDVSNFVIKLTGNSLHGDIFKDQEIDGEAMLLLTQGDIAKAMRIKVGPAVKIYNAILLLKNSKKLPV